MKNFILISIIVLCAVVTLPTNAYCNPRVAPCTFEIDFDEHVTLYFSKDANTYKTVPDDDVFTEGKKTVVFILGFCSKVAFNNSIDYTSYLPSRLLKSDETYENVIVIEHGQICCGYYNFIAETIYDMGEYLAGRLLGLGLTPDLIVGAAHSVGCHVFDPISTTFQKWGLGKIPRIWGLCPASDGYDGPEDGPIIKGLNPETADTVVQVYTDNREGAFKVRGTSNYLINPWCTIQPGCTNYECNHFACLTVLHLAFDPKAIENEEAFVGGKCFQDVDGCYTNDETSKLSPSSGEQTGCFCPNVDYKPPYYLKPSELVCPAPKQSEDYLDDWLAMLFG